MPSAKEYVPLWVSYLDSFEPYSDAEVGRLTRAMIKYKLTGAEPEFSGNERYIWPTIRGDIDAAISSYEAKSQQLRENGKKGGRPRKADAFEENQKKQMVFEESKKSNRKEIKLKETKHTPPFIPPPGETGFSEGLQSAFEDWLAYKAEKRQNYTETGLKTLVKRIRDAAVKYGDCFSKNPSLFSKTQKTQAFFRRKRKKVPPLIPLPLFPLIPLSP